MGAVFAVPGALSTPTGGYAYARRLLGEARKAGIELVHWPLPGGFPQPDAEDLEETARRLEAAPAGWAALIDGLALGALPGWVLDRATGPIVGLCHHPLALETGLDRLAAERLARSEREALARCARVVTTSRTTADCLIAEYGVPAQRIAVAPPGTDPAPAACGSGGPEVAILSVGSLVPRKGHDTLIRALGRLVDLDWRLTIVGAERDGGHAGALRALVEGLGLAARVTFSGAASEFELEGLYHRSDLFALASRHEGFGMVYAEAIARGLPVVGTTAGAIPEATAGAAELVAPGDEEALASRLGRLIADAEARRALAGRSRAAAASLPRWGESLAIVAGVLREVAPAVPAVPHDRSGARA